VERFDLLKRGCRVREVEGSAGVDLCELTERIERVRLMNSPVVCERERNWLIVERIDRDDERFDLRSLVELLRR